MLRFTKPVLLLALILALAGCSQRTDITGPENLNPTGLSQGPGNFSTQITLDSAMFRIYVVGTSSETINIHNVTADWVENMVTWNNFAGAYAPEIVGSFTPNAVGWFTVDITALAQAWLDGRTSNFGLLLEQAQGSLTAFASSEDFVFVNHPLLQLCYTENGIQECITIQRGTFGEVHDSYIREDVPDAMFGESPILYTGYLETLEKQTLVKFVLPVECDTAAIGDFVWHDSNCDGLRDRGEEGVPGISVMLFSCRDTSLVDSTVTGRDGSYEFFGVEPGNYFLRFFLPRGYEFSPMDQGRDDCIDSDVSPRGLTECFTIDSCEIDFCWDAGICIPDTDEGCTLTIGFWKNHAGFGPQADVVTPLLPIWLGTPDSSSGIHVTTARIAYDILTQHVYGAPSNGITKLYAQMLAAKLNIANGASPDDVDEAIDNADEFLGLFDWHDWSSLTQEQRQRVQRLHGLFGSYNEGFIGPGHCDDGEEAF